MSPEPFTVVISATPKANEKVSATVTVRDSDRTNPHDILLRLAAMTMAAAAVEEVIQAFLADRDEGETAILESLAKSHPTIAESVRRMIEEGRTHA